MDINTSILALVREDLAGFTGYSSARSAHIVASIWLNANEAYSANDADPTATVRRYPAPQPDVLRQLLADMYNCQPDQLLLGRGSDEAIDLLVRALCRSGRDAVLITSPVFGMYAVCARLQCATLIDVPLLENQRTFEIDTQTIITKALHNSVKLLFLCSPSNPTGNSIPLRTIQLIAHQLEGKAIVVVDEAYAEFSNQPSAISLLANHPNIGVLRTLSKAHALAGARLGCLIAHPALIGVLRACQAPYPIPAPSAYLVEKALSTQALDKTRQHISTIIDERNRMQQDLAQCACVDTVYPSDGNFLLVRFNRPQDAYDALLAAHIAVRDQRKEPQLANALRITIGSSAENTAVLNALHTLD